MNIHSCSAWYYVSSGLKLKNKKQNLFSGDFSTQSACWRIGQACFHETFLSFLDKIWGKRLLAPRTQYFFMEPKPQHFFLHMDLPFFPIFLAFHFQYRIAAKKCWPSITEIQFILLLSTWLNPVQKGTLMNSLTDENREQYFAFH